LGTDIFFDGINVTFFTDFKVMLAASKNNIIVLKFGATFHTSFVVVESISKSGLLKGERRSRSESHSTQ
jgi:hypothetical protein